MMKNTFDWLHLNHYTDKRTTNMCTQNIHIAYAHCKRIKLYFQFANPEIPVIPPCTKPPQFPHNFKPNSPYAIQLFAPSLIPFCPCSASRQSEPVSSSEADTREVFLPPIQGRLLPSDVPT